MTSPKMPEVVRVENSQFAEMQKDAERYRTLIDAIYRGNINVGEAYLTLKVVGKCPEKKDFDLILDLLGEE